MLLLLAHRQGHARHHTIVAAECSGEEVFQLFGQLHQAGGGVELVLKRVVDIVQHLLAHGAVEDLVIPGIG